MPSQSKPNIIGNLRRKYEPHMKLSAKVDLNHKIIHGIEGKLGDLPKIHKTLSKSFGMQRKTLMRVLGLEKRLSNLEIGIEIWTTREGIRRQKEEEEQSKVDAVEEKIEELEEELEELGEEIPEGLDDLLDDVRGDKAKKKPKKDPKVIKLDGEPKFKSEGKKKRPVRPTAKKIPKGKKKPKAKKRKVSPSAFKRGTSQETISERLDRLEQNAKDTAAGEEHKKTAEFTEISTGTDPATGEPLSPEERKRRFKIRKRGISPEAFKTGTSQENAYEKW